MNPLNNVTTMSQHPTHVRYHRQTIHPSMTQEDINETHPDVIDCESRGVQVTERFSLRHIIPDDNNRFSLLRPLTRWNRNSTVIHSSCENIANKFADALLGNGTCENGMYRGTPQTTCTLHFDRVSHTQNGEGTDRQPAWVNLTATQLGGGRYRINHLSHVDWRP